MPDPPTTDAPEPSADDEVETAPPTTPSSRPRPYVPDVVDRIPDRSGPQPSTITPAAEDEQSSSPSDTHDAALSRDEPGGDGTDRAEPSQEGNAGDLPTTVGCDQRES